MLNYEIFKMIKPTGSVDDYESGAGGDSTPKKRSSEAVEAIRDALSKNGAMSINEIISITGTSQGGTHGIMTRLLHEGAVTVNKVPSKSGRKPTGYFSLAS